MSAKKGKPLTQEHKDKISKAQKGVPKDWVHRQNISEALMGNQNRAKQLRLF